VGLDYLTFGRRTASGKRADESGKYSGADVCREFQGVDLLVLLLILKIREHHPSLVAK
jgi:hypothetical protein